MKITDIKKYLEIKKKKALSVETAIELIFSSDYDCVSLVIENDVEDIDAWTYEEFETEVYQVLINDNVSE